MLTCKMMTSIAARLLKFTNKQLERESRGTWIECHVMKCVRDVVPGVHHPLVSEGKSSTERENKDLMSGLFPP